VGGSTQEIAAKCNSRSFDFALCAALRITTWEVVDGWMTGLLS
jgi:hypothetical protein